MTTFFTKDRTFYHTFFPLLVKVALQNLVACSVNMADNMMLGNYSQLALSGAAVGTLTASAVELVLIRLYILKGEKRIRLFSRAFRVFF